MNKPFIVSTLLLFAIVASAQEAVERDAVVQLVAPGTGRAFCKWMNENGYADTRYADGERAADSEVLMELARTGDLDVYLPDIRSYGGITPWVNVMPKLAGMGVEASPHTWGQTKVSNRSEICVAEPK